MVDFRKWRFYAHKVGHHYRAITLNRNGRIKRENVFLCIMCDCCCIAYKTCLVCVLMFTGMKKELQLLRDEIKTIGGQIHKKIKSKYCEQNHITEW